MGLPQIWNGTAGPSCTKVSASTRLQLTLAMGNKNILLPDFLIYLLLDFCKNFQTLKKPYLGQTTHPGGQILPAQPWV